MLRCALGVKCRHIMEYYVYIKSDDSNDYFADNKPYRFKVHLKTPLVLKGFWKVALTEFYAKLDSSVRMERQTLYIYTDFCKESIVFGQGHPILRRVVPTRKNQWKYSFESDIYTALYINIYMTWSSI